MTSLVNATPQIAHPPSEQFGHQLAEAAFKRTAFQIRYDGRYRRIDYPGGDVPAHTGVCTDVVVRSYRALGIDLQQLVHEDISQNFTAYPSKRLWGLSQPDSNIDHRRVPNLQTFFTRKGHALTPSKLAENYLPGDLVTWMLPHNLPHIGIVSSEKSRHGAPMIVHNIGNGPELEDMLFVFPITGHYRYRPDSFERKSPDAQSSLSNIESFTSSSPARNGK